MDTATIRQKLHNYLEVADDKKVRAIYTMMETEVENGSLTYTDELKSALDERFDDYKSRKTDLITEADSRERIHNILGAKGK
ncbi:MAG: hypothetical protein ACYCZO_02445 [Daejeonella sp.]